MTPTHVYLVSGSTGEYSDHTEWPVAVYLDREMAELHAELANKVVAGVTDFDERDELEQKGNPYDPGMSISYNGCRYLVLGIPFVRHVDEFRERYDKTTPQP